eukprot:PLAT14252.1.p2 GENE.PLAT14252.1~~PLAT14252.1.p2  ORF type:complete len:232 (+),score=91.16 PLAT14252.1:36-698(+)
MAEETAELIREVDFAAFRDEMEAYDAKRERMIKSSRDVLKLSKHAIFSMHRGQMDKASSQLADAEALARDLLPMVEEEPSLRRGAFGNAMEEYAEARLFQYYLLHSRVMPFEELGLVDRVEYLGGVVDFTGELGRVAVLRATERDVDAVRRARDIVDAIMGQFVLFDFRNGPLRKKFDSLKYTLKKMENILYELSLTKSAVSDEIASASERAAPDAAGSE